MLEGGGSGTASKSMSGGKAKTAALRRRASGATGRSVGRTAAKVTGGSSRRSSGSSSSRRGGSGSYSNRGSSGGSSGGGGGGGGGYSAPKSPSLSQYLGTDSIYQSAVKGGKRSLNDFISELGRRRGEAGTQYNQTKGSMERDRTTQLDQLRNEFASRGLIQSGLYGEEQGNFQKKFTEQMSALDQQQAALLADLMSQQTNYKRENDLALEAAKQEALLRRAQKYG